MVLGAIVASNPNPAFVLILAAPANRFRAFLSLAGRANGVCDGIPTAVGGRDIGLGVNIGDTEEISLVHAIIGAREPRYVCGR